jgi:hypothetical protein
MECECSKHGDYVALNQGVDAFVGQFETVSTDSQKWATLYCCPNCNQHWQIDVGAEIDRRIPLAIKIADPDSWHTFNDRESRRQYFIDSHGGLIDEVCHWKDCSNKCVNGIVFCPEHVSSW